MQPRGHECELATQYLYGNIVPRFSQLTFGHPERQKRTPHLRLGLLSDSGAMVKEFTCFGDEARDRSDEAAEQKKRLVGMPHEALAQSSSDLNAKNSQSKTAELEANYLA